jgi:Phosphotransferase enzyme family
MFAWSRPAALRLAREIGVLTALAREPKVPFLPEVVARQRAEAAVGTLTGAQLPPVPTTTLRERLGTWVRPDQRRTVVRWCDWADAVLGSHGPGSHGQGSAGPAVLVHGDFHGDNMVWDRDELRLVLDLENIGAAEPEYELRTFPGPAMGPGLELLAAIMRHYQQVTGRQLSLARVVAWHLRQVLGDVLWHSEAGLPMADHRTPPQWVEDLGARRKVIKAARAAPLARRQRRALP